VAGVPCPRSRIPRKRNPAAGIPACGGAHP
jgi:hypothetical protein